MKITISKTTFEDALQRMKVIATKGVKSTFEMAHRITIKAEKSDVQFFATNGHLDARWEITSITDPHLKCETPGSVIVDATVAVGVVAAIGGSSKDVILDVELDGDTLHIKDSTSKSKKKVKLQTLAKDHPFKIKKPTNGFSFSLNREQFSNMYFVGGFQAKGSDKPRYHMVCMHFFKGETRFVCGDGRRFAICTENMASPNNQVDTDDGVKFLIPVDQLSILSSVLNGAERIDFIYENEQSCYIKPANAMEMKLHGIPNEKYVAYEKHAFCLDKARLFVDVKTSELSECLDIVASVRDNEREEQGIYHHANFILNGNNALEFIVNEQKYQCEVECPASIYHIQGERDYKSIYAAVYLKDILVLAKKKSTVRFYCVDEKGTLVTEPIELDDTNKVNGIPQARKDSDNPKMSLFFTAIVEED